MLLWNIHTTARSVSTLILGKGASAPSVKLLSTVEPLHIHSPKSSGSQRRCTTPITCESFQQELSGHSRSSPSQAVGRWLKLRVLSGNQLLLLRRRRRRRRVALHGERNVRRRERRCRAAPPLADVQRPQRWRWRGAEVEGEEFLHQHDSATSPAHYKQCAGSCTHVQRPAWQQVRSSIPQTESAQGQRVTAELGHAAAGQQQSWH